MEDAGIITKCYSPWSSKTKLPRKSSEALRMVHQYKSTGFSNDQDVVWWRQDVTLGWNPQVLAPLSPLASYGFSSAWRPPLMHQSISSRSATYRPNSWNNLNLQFVKPGLPESILRINITQCLGDFRGYHQPGKYNRTGRKEDKKSRTIQTKMGAYLQEKSRFSKTLQGTNWNPKVSLSCVSVDLNSNHFPGMCQWKHLLGIQLLHHLMNSQSIPSMPYPGADGSERAGRWYPIRGPTIKTTSYGGRYLPATICKNSWRPRSNLFTTELAINNDN